MRIKSVIPALMLGTVMMSTSGCLYEPDHFTDNRVQVEQKLHSETLAVSQLNDEAIKGVAQVYHQHGDGPLDLVVTYDPKSSQATAMNAADQAAKLAKMFRENGVAEVRSNIMPVHNAGEEMQALLSYDSYTALPPKDCGLLPGIETRHIETEEEYKLGCSVDTMYARQIARPKDLKGQAAPDPTTDGRRAANIVDIYRSGVPNEPLEGESASGE